MGTRLDVAAAGSEGQRMNREPTRIPAGEVQRLVHHLAIAIRQPELTVWERTFCASGIGASRGRRAWHPSVRQASITRRLVDAFLERALRVVEDEGESDLVPMPGFGSGGRRASRSTISPTLSCSLGGCLLLAAERNRR